MTPHSVRVDLLREDRELYWERRDAYRREKGITGSDRLHFAWLERGEELHQVHVVAGFELGAQGQLRLAHELWHIVTGLGNRHHHSCWDFCIAAKVPLRRGRSPCLPDELEARLLGLAAELRRHGSITLDLA